MTIMTILNIVVLFSILIISFICHYIAFNYCKYTESSSTIMAYFFEQYVVKYKSHDAMHTDIINLK